MAALEEMDVSTHARLQRGRASRSGLQIIGVTLLILGALGVAAWAPVALFAASHGATAAETVAGQIAEVGYEDPVHEPEKLTGWDESGAVVFEGTQEELDVFMAEGRAEYQANLRQDWLFVPAAVTALGIVLIVIARRDHDATSDRS